MALAALWPVVPAGYHQADVADDDERSDEDLDMQLQNSGLTDVHTDARQDQDQERERERKRQRRSIFVPTHADDSDSDSDALDDKTLQFLRPDSARDLAVVPATPFCAHTLGSGTCLLTPSFPRLPSSPCLLSASTDPKTLDISTAPFVAVCEEANASFRAYMEDRAASFFVDGVAYLGVFDGHGGIDASSYLQRNLLSNIQAHLQPGCDVHDALQAAYASTNASFRATGSIQGSTATTVILKDRRLIAANVGDSPAWVIKRSGEVFSIIQEHKIEGEEAARLAAQGVPMYRSPTGPTYMGTPDHTRWLNMSRAFGDFVYPAILCEPHVCTLDVSDGKYLVIGSDGLTEKWPVAEAAQYVAQLASHGWALPAIARCMVERAMARGSTDNISCMVVDLEAYATMAGAQALAQEPHPEQQKVKADDTAMDRFTAQQQGPSRPLGDEEDTMLLCQEPAAAVWATSAAAPASSRPRSSKPHASMPLQPLNARASEKEAEFTRGSLAPCPQRESASPSPTVEATSRGSSPDRDAAGLQGGDVLEVVAASASPCEVVSVPEDQDSAVAGTGPCLIASDPDGGVAS